MNTTEQQQQSEPQEDGLIAALGEWEKHLETPIVPGEMPNWLETAERKCEEIGVLLENNIHTAHQKLLEVIFEEDPEMASQVEELKKEDQAILSQWRELTGLFEQLREKAAKVEPHESKLDQRVEQLTSKGLAFIIRTRKQEAALSTWYVEAFQRDRGIAD